MKLILLFSHCTTPPNKSTTAVHKTIFSAMLFYMRNEDNIIDVLDYEGNRVILTKRKLEQKALQHPELKNKKFLENLIRTIENPEEVWQDQQDPKTKRCYYKKYSAGTYVKVVVWVQGKTYNIVSAFETNKIKETLYPKLKRLR